MEKIQKVKDLFLGPKFKTPFSMCIKTRAKYFSGLYKDFQLYNGYVVLTDSESSKKVINISVGEIVDIQLYKDANGIPIFLHDFEKESGDIEVKISECE